MSHMTGPFYVEETRAFRWVVRSRTATFYRQGNQSNEARYLASHILTREDAEFIADACNAQDAIEAAHAQRVTAYTATREDAEFIADAVNAQDATEDERAPSGAAFREGVGS